MAVQPTNRAVVVFEPGGAPQPIVVDSPHSGMDWPDDFLPSASRQAILTTWDAFVDELWGGAPAAGATLLAARFPRAYLDVNRAEDDIDPDLIEGTWPWPLRVSDYSRRGMGLIRRLALPGVPMYDRRLRVDEVQARIDRCYRPYRAALREAIDGALEAHGVVVHLNAHSMKSRGNAMNVDAGATRPDVVVSDRHGTTAVPDLTAWVAAWFHERGLATQVNTPYQGGDLVASFGAPSRGVHSLQIELNRVRYMDEPTLERAAGFAPTRDLLTALMHALAAHIAGGGVRRGAA